jgi:hypothetical protein
VVKSVRKIVESGLDLLVGGCVEESPAGIRISTGVEREGSSGLVRITVKELSQTRPVLELKSSLRQLVKGMNMRREAGLLLLSSLPGDNHWVEAEKIGGLFHFSVKVQAPIDTETRKNKYRGDTRDRIE